MKIETATQKDYPEIMEVWEASVRATHDFITEEDIRHFKPLILNIYLDAVVLRCARDGSGNIIGFMGVADGKIEMLFLDPGHRGTGIGRAFVTYARDNLGADKVDVNEQNHQAVGFYRHMGFRVVGRSETDGSGKPYPLLHMEL